MKWYVPVEFSAVTRISVDAKTSEEASLRVCAMIGETEDLVTPDTEIKQGSIKVLHPVPD